MSIGYYILYYLLGMLTTIAFAMLHANFNEHYDTRHRLFSRVTRNGSVVYDLGVIGATALLWPLAFIILIVFLLRTSLGSIRALYSRVKNKWNEPYEEVMDKLGGR